MIKDIQGSTLFPRSCETGRQNISNSPSLRSLSLVPRRKLEKDNNILGRKWPNKFCRNKVTRKIRRDRRPAAAQTEAGLCTLEAGNYLNFAILGLQKSSVSRENPPSAAGRKWRGRRWSLQVKSSALDSRIITLLERFQENFIHSFWEDIVRKYLRPYSGRGPGVGAYLHLLLSSVFSRNQRSATIIKIT